MPFSLSTKITSLLLFPYFIFRWISSVITALRFKLLVMNGGLHGGDLLKQPRANPRIQSRSQ